MQLYITKKWGENDKFEPASVYLPYMHICTPEVVISKDVITGAFYVSASKDESFIGAMIKLKRVLCRHEHKKIEQKDDKFALTDDIIYLRPSPILYYKSGDDKIVLPCNRLLLDMPVKLQLSVDGKNIMNYPKPYSSYNLVFTIDYVTVLDDFNWNVLS